MKMRVILIIICLLCMVNPTTGYLYESGYKIGNLKPLMSGSYPHIQAFYPLENGNILALIDEYPTLSSNETAQEFIRNNSGIVLINYELVDGEFVEGDTILMRNAWGKDFVITDNMIYFLVGNNIHTSIKGYDITNFEYNGYNVSVDMEGIEIPVDLEVENGIIYIMVENAGSYYIKSYNSTTGENIHTIKLFKGGLADHGPIQDMAISDGELWVWLLSSRDGVRAITVNEGALMRANLTNGDRIEAINEDPNRIAPVGAGLANDLAIVNNKLYAFFDGYVFIYDRDIAIVTSEPYYDDSTSYTWIIWPSLLVIYVVYVITSNIKEMREKKKENNDVGI